MQTGRSLGKSRVALAVHAAELRGLAAQLQQCACLSQGAPHVHDSSVAHRQGSDAKDAKEATNAGSYIQQTYQLSKDACRTCTDDACATSVPHTAHGP
jgi:hypothetical protein